MFASILFASFFYGVLFFQRKFNASGPKVCNLNLAKEQNKRATVAVGDSCLHKIRIFEFFHYISLTLFLSKNEFARSMYKLPQT